MYIPFSPELKEFENRHGMLEQCVCHFQRHLRVNLLQRGYLHLKDSSTRPNASPLSKAFPDTPTVRESAPSSCMVIKFKTALGEV